MSKRFLESYLKRKNAFSLPPVQLFPVSVDTSACYGFGLIRSRVIDCHKKTIEKNLRDLSDQSMRISTGSHCGRKMFPQVAVRLHSLAFTYII